MIDEIYENDVPYQSGNTDDSVYTNKSVFDFFDMYVPINMDDEMDERYDDGWHALDYSMQSDTVATIFNSKTQLILTKYQSMIGKGFFDWNGEQDPYNPTAALYSDNPTGLNAYTSLLIYGIFFENANPGSNVRDVDFYAQDYSSSAINFRWQNSNYDLSFKMLSNKIVPVTDDDIAVANIAKSVQYKPSNYMSVIMRDKLGFSASEPNIADPATLNRRMYLPLLFIRKKARVRGTSTDVAAYENIKSLEMSILPYTTLELDPLTTTVIGTKITLKGVEYNLHKAQITAFSGAPAYAKEQTDSSVLESIKYAFKDNDFCVGASTYNSTYSTYDMNATSYDAAKYKISPDFPIKIKSIYRTNDNIFIEYFIRTDYKTMAPSTYAAETGIKQANANVFTGPAKGNINIISTGSYMVSGYIYGFFDPYPGYAGHVYPNQEPIQDKSSNETIFANGLKRYREIYNSMDWRDNNGVGKGLNDLGVIGSFTGTDITFNSIPLTSMFMVVLSYDWNPHSMKAILEEGRTMPDSTMRDSTRINTNNNGGVVDAPGISIQFNLVR